MREIKFRVWCNNKEEWEKDYWMIDKYGDLWDVERRQILIPTNHILTQYTGLTDQNGKEIYEGDIMRDHYGYDGVEYTYHKVLFGEMPDCRWGYYLTNTGQATTVELFNNLEVIGNIYENPELLEE